MKALQIPTVCKFVNLSRFQSNLDYWFTNYIAVHCLSLWSYPLSKPHQATVEENALELVHFWVYFTTVSGSPQGSPSTRVKARWR